MSDNEQEHKLGSYEGREQWFQARRIDHDPSSQWESTLAVSPNHASRVFAESAGIDCEGRTVTIEVRSLAGVRRYRVQSATRVIYTSQEI